MLADVSDDAPNGDQPPVVLTIAGSDSCGGAGLHADLATFGALGAHGTCALTLVSAQNTAEFRSAVPMPPGMVLSQVEAVLDDLDVRSTKTGLLFTEANIAAVATIAERGRLPMLVVDPVLVGQTGRPLYDPDTCRLMVERLIPSALVLTPNHLEAGLLLGRPLGEDPVEWSDAARELAALGPDAVVITGGRRAGPVEGNTVDVGVVGGPSGEELVLEGEHLETVNVRGSGDTFSAAIVVGLANGLPLVRAIEQAHAFTARALAGAVSWRLGAGQGPLAHHRSVRRATPGNGADAGESTS